MKFSRRQFLKISGMTVGTHLIAGQFFSNVVFADGHVASFPTPVDLGERNGNKVTFKLEAKPKLIEVGGRQVELLTYNGSFPGPTLRMREGDMVQIEFTNSLSEETNLHFHGLHVPMIETNSETPFRRAAPGETITYEFPILNASAGTHWYHPHAHGLVAPQLFSGLAGAIIIDGPLDKLFADVPEQLLILKDFEFNAKGQVAEHSMMDWMLGREGGLLTINGTELPQLELTEGLMRLRLINAANARYFRLVLPGAELSVISTDGNYVARPYAVKELLLAPGERFDVLVEFKKVGLFNLMTLPYNRAPEDMMIESVEEGTGDINEVQGVPDNMKSMEHTNMNDVSNVESTTPSMNMDTASGDKSTHTMSPMTTDTKTAMTMPGHTMNATTTQPNNASSNMESMPMMGLMGGMQMSDMKTGVTQSTPLMQLNVMRSGHFSMPSELAAIKVLSPEDASERRKIVLTENMMGMEFYINGQLFDMNRVDFSPKLDTVEHWELINETGMDHPMHLHVFPFQVYARNGVKENQLVLKDVVNVKAGETVDLLIKFSDYEGSTVFHCHIVEHEDLGMMSIVEVSA